MAQHVAISNWAHTNNAKRDLTTTFATQTETPKDVSSLQQRKQPHVTPVVFKRRCNNQSNPSVITVGPYFTTHALGGEHTWL